MPVVTFMIYVRNLVVNVVRAGRRGMGVTRPLPMMRNPVRQRFARASECGDRKAENRY